MTMDAIVGRGDSLPSTGRRRFLARLLWLGILGLDPSMAAAGATRPTPPDPRAARLSALFPHATSAVVVGREYLRIAPAEREPGRLVDLIAAHCGAHVFDSDGPALRRCLDRRTRLDFAEGQIVEVHGWILSITEARICALAAAVLDPRSDPAGRLGSTVG